jgi:uncharacterized metal-binding protein
MAATTRDFSVAVGGVQVTSRPGEIYARDNISHGRIPVFSCEGPCIGGEIARLVANIVAEEVPSFARCCHSAAAFAPQSSMARWVKQAERAISIDGCSLKCHSRILQNLVDDERTIEVDALSFHERYQDVFLYTDVPQAEREAVAREVADGVIAALENDIELTSPAAIEKRKLAQA